MIICRSKHAGRSHGICLSAEEVGWSIHQEIIWCVDVCWCCLDWKGTSGAERTEETSWILFWATVWEVDPRDEMEDSMLFAIDDAGSTKKIPRHIWAKYHVRVDPTCSKHTKIQICSRGYKDCPKRTRSALSKYATDSSQYSNCRANSDCTNEKYVQQEGNPGNQDVKWWSN